MKNPGILLISPVNGGGPTTLYETLALKFPKKTQRIKEILSWILLHFGFGGNRVLISAIPFFWRPWFCKYFILNIHGDYRDDCSFNNPGSILAYIYPHAIKFSDLIVYPSEFLKKKLGILHPNQHIIQNMVSFELGTVRVKIPEEIRCCTVTNLQNPQKIKGLLDLADALSGWPESIKLTWTIIGGYRLEILNKITSICPQITVILLDKISRDRVEQYLDASDVFLYATHAESFGLAPMEASARGLPLILLPYDSFYEIFHQSSIFTKEQVVKTLLKMCTDASYYENQSRLSLQNSKRFLPEQILPQWKELFNTFE